MSIFHRLGYAIKLALRPLVVVLIPNDVVFPEIGTDLHFDEFDRLGKMPIVAESIKTLRSFGGNLAIVTQTIPALDEIYGENTRRSL